LEEETLTINRDLTQCLIQSRWINLTLPLHRQILINGFSFVNSSERHILQGNSPTKKSLFFEGELVAMLNLFDNSGIYYSLY
jgi:hypothetical protein